MTKTALHAKALRKSVPFCNSSVHRRATCNTTITAGDNIARGRGGITKTLLVMKLTAFLLTVAALNVSAKVSSQDVSFSGKKVALATVFSSVEAQTGFVFLYTDAVLSAARPVSISVDKEPLFSFLERIFKDQPLTYTIDGKNIAVAVTKKYYTHVDHVFNNISPSQFITGKVVDSLGNPLAGASIITQGKKSADSKKNISTTTLSDGSFSITAIEGDVLLVSYVGYETWSVIVTPSLLSSSDSIVITLRPSVSKLEDVTVTVFSTGYQNIPKERATGSFDFIDNKLINRTVASDFLSRIENLSPGILINHGDAASTDKFLIRGRSTIFANAQPLIVLDNFPYDGDLNSINPNNIENISILKDAAAASIWGARAANGVIVITTKQGKTLQPRLELVSNATWKKSPNLYNVRTISPADFIEAEKSLFVSGYYETDEFYNSLNYGHPPFTPVIELLRAKRDGLISEEEAETKINSYKQHDVRDDISRYLYQSSLNQQYAINLSGKNAGLNYFLSAGYDKSLGLLAGQHSGRLSLLSRNNIKINKWISAEAAMQYTQGTQYVNGNQGYQFNSYATKYFYPYAQFTNADGSPAYLDMHYNKQFTDTAGRGKLMNWKYSPIRDLHEQVYTVATRDLMTSTGLSFTITPNLSADIKYRYEYQEAAIYNLYTDSSFYARNTINNFTQIDFASGAMAYPIPKGGIEYNGTDRINSHQGRAQLNFHKRWDIHDVSAIAGYEIKHMVTTNSNTGYSYGIDKSISQLNNALDYVTWFKQYSNVYSDMPINAGGSLAKYVDNYLSYYANGAWTLKDRYILSGSFRKDEANLFGVATNLKGNPLWSAGAAWLLSEESFFHANWISLLKFRGTIGYSGNVSRSVSAVSTISIRPSSSSTYLPYAEILNPPNDNLRWEKVRMINLGVDFEILNHRIAGSAEYYLKKARDLLGATPVDPTLGISSSNNPSFFGNLASMKGHGLDLQINTQNIRGKLQWNTTLNFSYTTSHVTKYLMPVASSAGPYINSSISPLVGKPLFELFSYPWAGLDANNGDPLGYFDSKPSSDYTSIFNYVPLDSVTDNGNRQPLLYGAIRNTIGWKRLSLSFTISYKFKYYFRRSSVIYSSFSNWSAHADYAKRWQQPGDEKITTVPSYVFPMNSQREQFYMYSSALVEKADNIRLEDINLSYDIDRLSLKKLPFDRIRIFLLATGLGPIWKANKQGIDPYYDNTPLERPAFSAGVNLTL